MMRTNIANEVKKSEIRLSISRIDISNNYTNAYDPSLVTVPLPHLDATTENLDELIDRKTNSADFIGVSIDVDGRSVTPAVDVRASTLGLDVTDRLKADGISPNPWLDPATETKLEKLPPEKRATYAALGLAQWDEGKVAFFGWDVATTLHWIQEFPAGKTTRITVRHRPLFTRELITDVGIDRLAKTERCLDKPTEAALRAAFAANRPPGSAPGAGSALMARRVAVPLGAKAGEAIESFRLTVERPTPRTIVVVCGADRMKHEPDGLVWEAKALVPEGDLSVLFIEPPKVK